MIKNLTAPMCTTTQRDFSTHSVGGAMHACQTFNKICMSLMNHLHCAHV